MNFVERLVLKCGHVAQQPDPDYGYDLQLETFDEQGNREAEQVLLQIKATDNIDAYELAREESYSFPIALPEPGRISRPISLSVPTWEKHQQLARSAAPTGARSLTPAEFATAIIEQFVATTPPG